VEAMVDARVVEVIDGCEIVVCGREEGGCCLRLINGGRTIEVSMDTEQTTELIDAVTELSTN
jgi:hypothetical protein